MKLETSAKTYYIDGKSPSSSIEICNLLSKLITESPKNWSELVFVCIGSDRVTGDSLGPLIGYQLLKNKLERSWVYGTLERPVHALNLEQTMEHIKYLHPDGLVIAIDASLGSKKHQGYITLGQGSLFPGAGVHKQLPEVGDIFITGIINITGAFEHLLLQTTRLSIVMHIADCITNGILMAYKKYYEGLCPVCEKRLIDCGDEHFWFLDKNPEPKREEEVLLECAPSDSRKGAHLAAKR